MPYEYRFDRIELGVEIPLRLFPRTDYHQLVQERAHEGWRLVQVFAPSVFIMAGGVPDCFELIFERPVGGAPPPPR